MESQYFRALGVETFALVGRSMTCTTCMAIAGGGGGIGAVAIVLCLSNDIGKGFCFVVLFVLFCFLAVQ